MTQKKNIVIAFVGLLLLLSFLDSAFAADKLFIVANQKSLDLAKDFIATMNNESIPISVALDQYDKVKKEKYIFILGGTDEFTKQVLSKEDMDAANQAGGKIFIRQDVFAQGQIIVVFTEKMKRPPPMLERTAAKHGGPWLRNGSILRLQAQWLIKKNEREAKI
jgi:hypothetical protein